MIKMFTRFEPTKSTKGASKMRRDLINAEIANLRDLLPLPPSTRQRLSQLQLMALICVYVRKANYFQQVLKCHDFTHHYHHHSPTPNIGFSKALNGFLMMMTQNGKLLYISDNAAEYLGHSMEDLLIHGDSVYDIIDKQDHQAVQAELCRPATSGGATPTTGASNVRDSRMFLCRINVARNARRQMRFGDQKVVLVRGHFLSYLPLCSRNEPVFLAACAPVAMPETRECVVQGATNVFTTIHSMDMKIKHIDKNGEWYLGWEKSELTGISWYQLLHWECMREAQSKHRLITQSEQERSCILLLRLQKHSGDWLWVHAVLQVKDNMENNQQPVIVCTNQVLNDSEATIMLANSWLYHYYSVQSKLQYGLAYDTNQLQSYYHPSVNSFSPSPYAINQESPYSQHSNEDTVHHHMINGPEQTHMDLQSPRQHPPPTVLRHSGGQVMVNQGFGFEGSMAERGPVDYSRHSSSFSSNERYVPQSSVDTRLSDSREGEPISSFRHHRKRKHSEPNSKLEPLQLVQSKESHIIVDAGGGGTLLALTTAADRSRYPSKPGIEDPADFIDRWNPSPPWSDTALQKVPQAYQELSYATATPLTPTGTPGALHGYGGLQNTFTFDWLPDHYVSHSGNVQPVLHIVCRDDEFNGSDSNVLRHKNPHQVPIGENSTHQQTGNSEADVEAS